MACKPEEVHQVGQLCLDCDGQANTPGSLAASFLVGLPRRRRPAQDSVLSIYSFSNATFYCVCNARIKQEGAASSGQNATEESLNSCARAAR